MKEILSNSIQKPQVIFKHSTRCSISSMAKNRLERSTAPGDVDFYYLDIINYRNLSNKVASDFNIQHESPQVLIISHGNCVYNESHAGIDMQDIVANAI